MSKKLGQCGTKADVKVQIITVALKKDEKIKFSVGKISSRKMVLHVLKMKPKQEIESSSTQIEVPFSYLAYP